MSKPAYKAYCEQMQKMGKKPADEAAYNNMSDEEYSKMSMSKASVAASELLKSIDAYKNVESALDTGATRQAELEAKIASGTISKSERVELAKHYMGEEVAPVRGGDSIRKSLSSHVRENADGDAERLVDASPALQALMDGFDTRIDGLAKSLSDDSLVGRQLMKAQGQLLADVGVCLKACVEEIGELRKANDSLEDRVVDVEGQPVAPRAVAADGTQINKGRPAADPPPNGGKISKGQVKRGLEILSKQAIQREDEQALSRLTMATAQFESHGTIDKQTFAAVTAVL